jgi:hypothetical protein
MQMYHVNTKVRVVAAALLSWLGAATGKALILMPLALGGCFLFAGSPADQTESLRLAWNNPSSCESRSESAPFIYRCAQEARASFVTGLRDCGIKEKFTTQATTRQLLVGIANLQIVKQEPFDVEAARPALLTSMRGVLDATPVMVTVVTERIPNEGHDCIVDYVFWQRTTFGSADDSSLRELETLARSFAREVRILSGEESGERG